MNKIRKTLKGVFFDMGGTLIFPHPGRISQTLFAATGRSTTPADCLTAVHHSTFLMDQKLGTGWEMGENWWEEYFGGMVDSLHSQPPLSSAERAAFYQKLFADHVQQNLWAYLADGARETLDFFANAGLYLGVISNSDGRVKSQLVENELYDKFSFVLDSHVVKCEKPDPAIFLMGIEKSGLDPGEVLYVGDFVNIDYKGATRVGMRAVIIDPLGFRKTWDAPTIQSLKLLPDWVNGHA